MKHNEYKDSAMHEAKESKAYEAMEEGGNYRPNGELQGDDRPMVDHGASKAGEYDKSLGGAKRSDLDNGYTGRSRMTGTDSDKGFA